MSRLILATALFGLTIGAAQAGSFYSIDTANGTFTFDFSNGRALACVPDGVDGAGCYNVSPNGATYRKGNATKVRVGNTRSTAANAPVPRGKPIR